MCGETMDNVLVSQTSSIVLPIITYTQFSHVKANVHSFQFYRMFSKEYVEHFFKDNVILILFYFILNLLF